MAIAYQGFCGPTGKTAASSLDCERTINAFQEQADAGIPKANPWLRKRPACDPWIGLGVGPLRQMFNQNGRTFAVSGNTFYELFASQTATVRGTMALDGNPASISQNSAEELFITSGGEGYVFDLTLNTLTQITDAEFITPAAMSGFTDGYSLSLNSSSAHHGSRFQISTLNDSSSWSGLDTAQTSFSSDDKVAMFVNHREVWLFGLQHTEVWVDNGAANFPFAPINGVFIEHGIIAPWSVSRLDNSIFWLGGDERGDGVVYRADGYTPARISTHAIESYLNGSWQAFGVQPISKPRLTDAIGWSYQEEGHSFYVLYVPTLDTTPVYDVATGQWHERSLWDPELMRHTPYIGRCHCYAFGKHLVGSRLDGTVYWQRLDRYEDQVVVA